MKRILLTSTALIAVAGSAFAAGHATDHGINWGGDAEITYNSDTSITNDDTNVSYSAGLTVSASTALDNGITATMAADVDLEFANAAAGVGTFDDVQVSLSDVVVGLSSDMASLTFGDTSTAGQANWVSAGDMEQDGFAENGDGAEDAILRGDVSSAGVKASVSYGLVSGDLDGLQVAASYDFGAGTVGFAYEDGDNGQNETRGVYLTTSFSGADVTVAYAETGDEDSTGIKVSYPVGDIILGAYYVSESAGDDNYGVDAAYTSGPLSVAAYYRDEQGDDDYGVDVDYDMGNGLLLKGGFAGGDGSDDGYYVGGEYNLGGGAAVSLTYVDADNANGDNEYFGDDDNFGTTLKLSLSF